MRRPSAGTLALGALVVGLVLGSIEALKFKKAEIGHLGPKSYVEASTNNYANVEPIAQLQLANGSLGYRSCLLVASDSDIFSPEDTAGKTFAFNDPISTSGYLVPSTFFMTEMNIDPQKYFSKVIFSGSHEASILAVANHKVEVASIIGTIQSMATNFPGLRPMWKQNCEEERLLGVDITGQLDSAIAQDAGVKSKLRTVAVEVNRQYAQTLGINQAAATTTVKPSGNSAQLLNCASGLHARWASYYIRNVSPRRWPGQRSGATASMRSSQGCTFVAPRAMSRTSCA